MAEYGLTNSNEEHYRAIVGHLGEIKKSMDTIQELVNKTQVRLNALTGRTPTTLGEKAPGLAPIGVSPLGGQAKY